MLITIAPNLELPAVRRPAAAVTALGVDSLGCSPRVSRLIGKESFYPTEWPFASLSENGRQRRAAEKSRVDDRIPEGSFLMIHSRRVESENGRSPRRVARMVAAIRVAWKFAWNPCRLAIQRRDCPLLLSIRRPGSKSRHVCPLRHVGPLLHVCLLCPFPLAHRSFSLLQSNAPL